MRLLLTALAVFPLLALSACKGSCHTLADLQCECLPTQGERDSCFVSNSSQNSSVAPTGEDEARCEALLETCQCGTTSTPEGKQACGLARD